MILSLLIIWLQIVNDFWIITPVNGSFNLVTCFLKKNYFKNPCNLPVILFECVWYIVYHNSQAGRVLLHLSQLLWRKKKTFKKISESNNCVVFYAILFCGPGRFSISTIPQFQEIALTWFLCLFIFQPIIYHHGVVP